MFVDERKYSTPFIISTFRYQLVHISFAADKGLLHISIFILWRCTMPCCQQHYEPSSALARVLRRRIEKATGLRSLPDCVCINAIDIIVVGNSMIIRLYREI